MIPNVLISNSPDPPGGEVAVVAVDWGQPVEELEVGVVPAVGRVEVVGQGEPQARRVVALGASVATSITVHMILYSVSAEGPSIKDVYRILLFLTLALPLVR